MERNDRQDAAERTVAVGVVKGEPTTRRNRKGEDVEYTPLDRVFLLDADGHKLSNRDCAVMARQFGNAAQDVSNVYGDVGTEAVLLAYAEHSAGAVAEAESKGFNVRRARGTKVPDTLTTAFQYTKAV